MLLEYVRNPMAFGEPGTQARSLVYMFMVQSSKWDANENTLKAP